MKKTTKYIIISILLIAVLVGAIFLLKYTEPADEEPSSEISSEVSTPETITLTDIELDDVASFEIKSSKNEMTIIKGEEKDDDGDVSDVYTVEGYENYELKSSIIGAFKNLLSLKATKEIGEVDNLESFELKGSEVTTVTVTMKNGSKEEIIIGATGGETTGRYVLVDGKVYITTISDSIYSAILDCFNLYTYNELVYDKNGTEVPAVIDYVTFSGTNFPEETTIKFIEDKAGYYLTAPIKNVNANFTFTENLPVSLTTFNTNGIAVLNATEEDLEEYGLKEPMATITYFLKDTKKEHTISVSAKTDNGNRYVLVDGITDTIYTTTDEFVSTWCNQNLQGVRNSYVYMPAIMDMELIEVEIDGKSYDVAFERTVNEEKTTETATMYDYTVKLDGKDIGYKDVTTSMYMSLISISVINMEESEYEEDPIVKVTYNTYDGDTTTISYHATKDDRYVAILDGEYTATVRNSSVTDFIKAFEEYKTKAE